MKQDVYVVVSSEYTSNPNEGSPQILGVFPTQSLAKDCMDKSANHFLAEFDDEYADFRNESQTIIRSKKNEDYRYEIDIVGKTIVQ